MIKLSSGINGRLGNKLLQNLGISILSKKYNLFPIYNNIEENNIIKLNLYYGNKKFEICKEYNDNDLEYLLDEKTSLDHGIIFNGYFQSKNLLFNYKQLVKQVINKRCITKKNQVFVCVRLDDVEHHNCGIDYYKQILDSISFNGGLVSSDSPNHKIVKKISQDYNLEIFNSSAIETILIGSEHEHRVLSGGTFSWWIGILGDNNNVYCRREPKFHGDIFVYPEWKYF